MPVQLVFDRERFDEMRDLLGPARFGSALGLFRLQLDHCLAETGTHPDQRGQLRALAHDLASSAGSLGFEELSSTSRSVSSLCGADAMQRESAQAIRDMRDALRRALITLAEVAA